MSSVHFVRDIKRERERESNEHARPAMGNQVKLMMMIMMMMRRAMMMILPVADAKRVNVKLGSASGK